MNYTKLSPDRIETLVAELTKEIRPEHIRLGEPMKDHTTFKTGGCAAVFLTPDENELSSLAAFLAARGIQPLVIGNGSNLLVSDEGLPGVVIRIGEEMAQIVVEREQGRIRVQAGARLGAVAREAAAAGLSGMEFASGIPGSIGGAVMMNAGAYGGEMKDILFCVTCLTPDSKAERHTLVTAQAPKDAFSYRHSMFMETGAIITSVELALTKGEADAIRAKMKELNGRRTEKQPLEYPSAGSTFKRPAGYYAGRLIEDAGLKGFRVGGACVSEKHAGFVVNDANASAQDVYDVICHVQQEVKKQFGVDLEPEVRIIGSFRQA